MKKGAILAIILGVLNLGLSLKADSLFDLSSPEKSTTLLNSEQQSEIAKLSHLSLEDQAQAISKEIPIKLLRSDRKGDHFFDFLGKAEKSIDEVAHVEALYGKVECPSENSKPVLYLADDAPPTTLLHQYIHYLQQKNEKRWCALQGRVLESSEKNEQALIFHRFEFEADKTLFLLEDKLTMNFEDRLILLEGLNRENTLVGQVKLAGLDDAQAQKLHKELELIHGQINYLKWLKRTPEDAQSVMEKMEVFNLDICTKASKDEDKLRALNECLAKRCALSHLTCENLSAAHGGETSLTLATRGWAGKYSLGLCDVSRLRDEILDDVRNPTPCWKRVSAELASQGKNKLQKINERRLIKNFNAPQLEIDKRISFLTATTPQTYIEKTYCYSLFDRVAGYNIIPVEQFSFASLGTIVKFSRLNEYRKWLETQEGKTCDKLVKIFANTEASRFNHIDRKKKYMFILNPLAAMGGGVSGFTDNVVSDINHERLHVIFSENKALKSKVKNEWSHLTEAEQKEFKSKHENYDFSNEDTLLREYFSFTRQSHPTVLF